MKPSSQAHDVAAVIAADTLDTRRTYGLGPSGHSTGEATLQQEFVLLGEVATVAPARWSGPGDGSAPYAVLRGPRDARFRIPRARLHGALDLLRGDLAQPVRTGGTLIVVSHPDDESIGAGAQLARLEDATVVHVTDGAPRDPTYARRLGFPNRDAYGEARRREAAAALELAGVTTDRQLCLGYPDGELPYHLVELSLSLADVIDELQPEVVITHPYEGGHTDHDATAFGVHLACGVLRREGAAVPVVLEMTSYHGAGGRRVVHSFLPIAGSEPVRTVELSPDAAALKRAMYDSYRTQRACLAQFLVAVERFRPAPRYVFTEPPHPGTLEYERRSRRMSGEQWRCHAARALKRLRTRVQGRVCGFAFPRSRTCSSADSSLYEVVPVPAP
jgi:N-acetylglucosamine malate deacetylase 2